jgi:hypothetical protein
MSNIAEDVVRTFLVQLADVDDVSAAVVEGLRDRLTADRLPTADDLAKLYSSGSGDVLA